MADIAGLRLFLRDSDDVKASIQVLSIPDSQDTSTSDTQLINAVSPTFKTILSVISHKDSVDQHEEGRCVAGAAARSLANTPHSVFVLREKSPSQTLEIERLIPVCGDFSVSIMQMRLDSSSQDRAGICAPHSLRVTALITVYRLQNNCQSWSSGRPTIVLHARCRRPADRPGRVQAPQGSVR